MKPIARDAEQGRKCWAACRGNCDSLSREHIFSRAVFSKAETPSISVLGLVNVPDGPVGKDGVASRILCRLHNSQLSELDAEAGRLAQEIHSWNLGHSRRVDINVDANTLERWAMKTVVNHFASGIGDDKKWFPEPAVVKMIFGEMAIPHGVGLFSLRYSGYQPKSSEQVGITPAWRGDLRSGTKDLMGAILFMHGTAFFVCFDPRFPDSMEREGIDAQRSELAISADLMRYHPRRMFLGREDGIELAVNFDWHGWAAPK